MKYLVSVTDDNAGAGHASPAEMAAIDAFNDRSRARRQFGLRRRPRVARSRHCDRQSAWRGGIHRRAVPAWTWLVGWDGFRRPVVPMRRRLPWRHRNRSTVFWRGGLRNCDKKTETGQRPISTLQAGNLDP